MILISSMDWCPIRTGGMIFRAVLRQNRLKFTQKIKGKQARDLKVVAPMPWGWRARKLKLAATDSGGFPVNFGGPQRLCLSASAPLTISSNSLVIDAWRALL